MSNEELQSKMEFIVNQQAQFAANFQKHEEAQANADERADKRLARLERVVKLIIRTGARERKDFRERYVALLDSQIKTEDTVRELSANVNELSTNVNELSVTVSELSTTVSELSVTVSELSITVSETSATVHELSATVSATSATVNELSATVGAMSGRVGDLTEGLKATKELTERNSEAIQALTQIVGRIAQKNGDSA